MKLLDSLHLLENSQWFLNATNGEIALPPSSLTYLARIAVLSNSANHPQALLHKFTFLYVLSMIAVTLPSTFKWWWMDLKKRRPASRRTRASSIESRR
ncbi:hypothetical protein BLNAU_17347 [Blattamonas nauphoetae]|uniref:Uncharacterized protein n=1 Tax=Blattamonas nauphoetae TaxID=2049346 RepID=A0ABQ9X941_9EUKA|nr:hypothetical protein BLNAU_17347 [Blattamonas nauphoetae]